LTFSFLSLFHILLSRQMANGRISSGVHENAHVHYVTDVAVDTGVAMCCDPFGGLSDDEQLCTRGSASSAA